MKAKKRRRVDIATLAPELARHSEVSVAKQGPCCFSCGNHREGSLFDAIGVVHELLFEPQVTTDFLEPNDLLHSSSKSPTGRAICENLSITNMFEFADPCLRFEFSVISTLASICWEDISRNLQITAKLAGGHSIPAVSLHVSTSFTVLPQGDDCLHITISSAWWSHATSFTIVGLYFAGQLICSPLLPATIKVMHVNHTPCKAGRLWTSSEAGDIAGATSAIKDGCSTEESKKVRNYDCDA